MGARLCDKTTLSVDKATGDGPNSEMAEDVSELEQVLPQ